MPRREALLRRQGAEENIDAGLSADITYFSGGGGGGYYHKKLSCINIVDHKIKN
jgi:hypothetical protein